MGVKDDEGTFDTIGIRDIRSQPGWNDNRSMYPRRRGGVVLQSFVLSVEQTEAATWSLCTCTEHEMGSRDPAAKLATQAAVNLELRPDGKRPLFCA